MASAPRETFKGAGERRKAGAGAGEAVRRGHFFFWKALPPKEAEPSLRN